MTEPAGAFPAPTWTPPAREPFVPMRPLTLGQILAGAFRALRHNPAVTLAPAILISIASALLATAVSLAVSGPLLDRLGSSTGASASYLWFAGVGAGLVGWVAAQSLALAAGSLQQGVSASDVAHAVLGRRLTPGGLRRRLRGVRGALALWTAAVLVACLTAGGVALLVLGGATLIDPFLGAASGLLIWPLSTVLLVWLGTKLAFVPSVIAVERARVGTALGRSWRLTRSRFWRTFGIRILSWGMIGLATGLVGFPVQLLTQWVAAILAGNGDVGDVLTIDMIGGVVASIVGAVIGAIGLVVTTATDAILYLDLRMRHEGLDLELARFMERRRATTRFDPNEPDPYRAPAAAHATAHAANPGRVSSWG